MKTEVISNDCGTTIKLTPENAFERKLIEGYQEEEVEASVDIHAGRKDYPNRHQYENHRIAIGISVKSK